MASSISINGIVISREEVAAAMSALDKIRAILTVGEEPAPAPLPLAPLPRQKKRPTAEVAVSDADRVVAATRIINGIKSGRGDRYRVKRFDRVGPRYSDFVLAVMGDAPFDLKTASNAVRPFVQLNEVQRKAIGSLRDSLINSGRFEKLIDGRYRAKPDAAS